MPIDAPELSPAVRAPVCVALSGGPDSVALLHALADNTRIRADGLRALHVHHGMHDAADSWAAHCIALCGRLKVPLAVEWVDVHANTGLGREGAARAARHAAFAKHLAPGEHLALAHHRDDQAETFLLRALRASGVDGLGSMAPLRPHGRGWLWRPWLGVSRERIAAYARDRGLVAVVDPSNSDTSLDRVYLREHVLASLRERWPHAAAALATSAAHSREAASLLANDDIAALAACTLDRADTLSIAAVLALVPARRQRVLRRWIASLDLPALPAQGLASVADDLLKPRPDAQPRFDWHDASIRAWGGQLHASRRTTALPDTFDIGWDGLSPASLPDGGGLSIDPPIALPTTTRIRARHGGERIRLPGRTHRHTLKHVLQDLGLPPWTREHLPLLVDSDEVLAAGDIAISASLTERLGRAGARLTWRRPEGA